MLILAGIVFLHITTIILLLVATIDNVSGSSFIFSLTHCKESARDAHSPTFKKNKKIISLQLSIWRWRFLYLRYHQDEKKLRVKRVCQRCVHTGVVGFQAIIDTASGYSWYAMFILAFLCVLRPGGSLKQCQRTCGESGSWQAPCGITPTWKITPRVSRCLKDLNWWYWSSRSHQKAVATMTWCDLIWDCLGWKNRYRCLSACLNKFSWKSNCSKHFPQPQPIFIILIRVRILTGQLRSFLLLNSSVTWCL